MIDYYELLQVSPSAPLSEIKSAYRRLAHLYHPDKDPGNKFKAAQFELIKEAYETLSHPEKKDRYLQERWLSRAQGQPFTQELNTPIQLLHKVLKISDSVSGLDIYRMNKESVRDLFSEVLNTDTIDMLNAFNETSVNDAIVGELVRIIPVLGTKNELSLISDIRRIQSNYESQLDSRQQRLENNLFWENWKPAFVILVVLLLCLLIWGTSLKN
ncbi:hypothetical protein GCM10027051_05540 [Niabella terrae]